MGNKKDQLNQSPESLDLYVAKLTFIGASIATLGDGLQALAAGIALEALEKEKSNNRSSQNHNGHSKQWEVSLRDWFLFQKPFIKLVMN